MKTETIEPGVYRVRGEAYDSAATLFSREGEAVLVDALGSRADAEALRRFVEMDLGSRVRFVIATHYFSDHMAALGHFPGADIVAHRAHRHTFDEELHRTDEERGFYAPPTLVVEGDLLLRRKGLSFDTFHNPGHTMSTLGVEVPELGMLHVGDSVVGRIVYFAYTSPEVLAEALLRLQRRRCPRILASHGGVGGPGRIESALHYLRTLRRRVREARRGGQPIEAIALADCLAPGLTPDEFEEVFHRRNLQSLRERGLWESPTSS